MDYVHEGAKEPRKKQGREQKPIDTATKARLKQAQDKQTAGTADLPAAALMRFDGSAHTDTDTAIPFSRVDYFHLVDETGRYIQDDKRGFIAQTTPKLIQQFNLNPDDGLNHIQQFGKRYAQCVGGKQALKSFAEQNNQKWV